MKALITGITGMDGSHLADLLLNKGYEVYGLERKKTEPNRTNTKHLEGKVQFVNGDLSDQCSLTRTIKNIGPDEVYNLAAQSSVVESWNTAEYTSNITGLGVLRILEAIRSTDKNIRFYQASSSEMFGTTHGLANEDTPFYPRSPYGVAKIYGFQISRNYRESYGMFNCSGILFNHDSERRGLEYVTRKISHGVASISLGLSDHLVLGNLDVERDWGYAPDYMKAVWLMLQQDSPDDYVIATGKAHTVRDFLTAAFDQVGISNWAKYIKQDDKYMRPAEIRVTCGDNTKAKTVLNWSPKIFFNDIVRLMVSNDLRLLQI
jgi:GDPmannose 4,6-dehydratase